MFNNLNGRIVLRKALLMDWKSKGGHLGYPGFPTMYEFVISVIVIPVILHFKRFRLLNSAGTSSYKNVTTPSELQVGATSSDVWGTASQLHPVIPATPICTLQWHRKRLRLLRCLNEGARARTYTHTQNSPVPSYKWRHLYLYSEWTHGLRMLQI
jgi:hypothetical protein